MISSNDIKRCFPEQLARNAGTNDSHGDFTPKSNLIFHHLSLAGADQHDAPIGWPTFNLFGVNAA